MIVLTVIVFFGLSCSKTSTTEDSITITTINGTSVSDNQTCMATYKNKLHGTSTNSSSKGYVIVKPLNGGPNWYVQPPAPVVHIGNGEWMGKAFLGTSTEGVGEDFLIFIVVPKNKTYKGEQKLSSEPEGVKSNRIVCERNQ